MAGWGLRASENVPRDPGGSNELIVPFGSRTKPWSEEEPEEPAVYRPTIQPAGLMSRGTVALAPTGSNEVIVPSGSRTKPWTTDKFSYCPIILPAGFIVLANVRS